MSHEASHSKKRIQWCAITWWDFIKHYMLWIVIVEGVYGRQQAIVILTSPKLHSSSNPFCCSQGRWRERERETAVMRLVLLFSTTKQYIFINKLKWNVVLQEQSSKQVKCSQQRAAWVGVRCCAPATASMLQTLGPASRLLARILLTWVSAMSARSSASSSSCCSLRNLPRWTLDCSSCCL